MKSIWLSFLFSISSVFAMDLPNPMEDKKPIEIQPGFLSTKFLQDGHIVKPGSMYDILERYPESREAASSSKVWMYPGLGFGAVGGFLLGFEAVQPLVGGKFNAPLFFTGLGSVAIGVAFGKISENKLVQAVKSYNDKQGKLSINGYLLPAEAGFALTYHLGFQK